MEVGHGVKGLRVARQPPPEKRGMLLLHLHTYRHLLVGWQLLKCLAGNRTPARSFWHLLRIYMYNFDGRRTRLPLPNPTWGSLHVLITWLPTLFTLFDTIWLAGPLGHWFLRWMFAAIPWDRTMFMLLTNFLTFFLLLLLSFFFFVFSHQFRRKSPWSVPWSSRAKGTRPRWSASSTAKHSLRYVLIKFHT